MREKRGRERKSDEVVAEIGERGGGGAGGGVVVSRDMRNGDDDDNDVDSEMPIRTFSIEWAGM